MIHADPWERPESRDSRGDVHLFRLGVIGSIEQASRVEEETKP